MIGEDLVESQKNKDKDNYQQDQEYEKRHRREVLDAFRNYSRDMMMTWTKVFQKNKVSHYFDLVCQRKKQKIEKAIEANQYFLNQIVNSVEEEQQIPKLVTENPTSCTNISKIRTTVKQFFREWCFDSPEVKDFKYLAEKAKKYMKAKDRVLVPGCGLGRLALELVESGFSTQGNQVTYFMLFGSNFILNEASRRQQFEIYPFIHQASGHETEDDMFRSVKVPDKVAVEVVPQEADFGMVAGQFTEIYGKEPESFEGVISCFFLDTANNIFQYISCIKKVLKPGGMWINLGPLLFHYKDMLEEVSVQISWEQVLSYIQDCGFTNLECQRYKTTYCHDPKSTYKHLYDCELNIWRKSS